ncbi:MAG: hypothetical protein U0935_04160 [Pirellulales bacterium]
MGRVANPQLRSEWQARLERWQRSGLGVREFCAGEDVGEPAFYQWRKKLGGKAREVREKRVASTPIKSLPHALFLPLEIARATWVVYHDPLHEVWTGQGYATGESFETFTLENPVSITKFDAKGQALEQIQAVRASTIGELGPDDSFPQTSYVRWSTRQYTDCCLLASTRVYHAIPSSGAGSPGTHYDETVYGYDSSKRQNRQVTPGGTITRMVHDGAGNPWKTFVGTIDTSATETDPTGGGRRAQHGPGVAEPVRWRERRRRQQPDAGHRVCRWLDDPRNVVRLRLAEPASGLGRRGRLFPAGRLRQFGPRREDGAV